MTNPEIDPAEYECAYVRCADAIDIITPRNVPLGGPRAMRVRRTLPQRKRTLIGPWCFVDHFGPDDVTGGMAVPQHPHTGLATVTLLFQGAIEHIDSTGFQNIVEPAGVNLMIAGSGICHSEFSTGTAQDLHGVQLWYALPEALRNGMPESQHHVADRTYVNGGSVMTYLGSLAGITSPVDTRVPALAAEVSVSANSTLELEVEPGFEHGILSDTGKLTVLVDQHEQTIAKDQLAYLPSGPRTVRLRAEGSQPVRAILIGGEPFPDRLVMWWNFIGRTHEEIVAYREAWQTEIAQESFAGAAAALETGAYPDGAEYPRFGRFPSGQPAALPAPSLPNVRIRPREQR